MNLEQARFNMIEQQIRTWEVLDQEVLELLYTVPREAFVPAALRSLAFIDMELPLGDGERMWAPKMEARVLQALEVRKTDRVLEVGTGSGYFCALLAQRAAHVHSVEIRPQLAAFGRANLERHGADNVTLEIGDAARGWKQKAPFDVIVFTGSVPVLPGGIFEQMAEHGRLFAIVGDAPAMAASLITQAVPGKFARVELFETVVAPLVNCEHPARFRF